jgi:hypothetical protein
MMPTSEIVLPTSAIAQEAADPASTVIDAPPGPVPEPATGTSPAEIPRIPPEPRPGEEADRTDPARPAALRTGRETIITRGQDWVPASLLQVGDVFLLQRMDGSGLTVREQPERLTAAPGYLAIQTVEIPEAAFILREGEQLRPVRMVRHYNMACRVCHVPATVLHDMALGLPTAYLCPAH